MTQPVIYWFRNDLRLGDLEGLHAAASAGGPIIPCYVLDDETPGRYAPGGASRWWLHYSLEALAGELRDRGGWLLLRRGDAGALLPELVREVGARGVYCSRGYAPWEADLERRLHDELEGEGVEFRRFGGRLLHEPEQVQTTSGGPFKVFTPFWKRCLQLPPPGAPLAVPDAMQFPATSPDGLALDELRLRPENPDWAAHWTDLWQPGERGASGALRAFLSGPIEDYDESRNHPARAATSLLSPHLHCGEISPRQVWHTVQAHCAGSRKLARQRDKFLAELGWREFSYHLLHHFPHTLDKPFKEQFEDFPWPGGEDGLRAWQRGETGYPMVDAGMRELWHTGYMHNRVRMITASFLTKHLLVDWRRGEAWFRDTLVDADVANNVAGWQWVAGSGADAAPYFRIFNPNLQGRKFDESGDYVRQWVPELAALPDRHIHEPAAAPGDILEAAGVALGETYPLPIVEHRGAREAALAAYAQIRQG